MPHSVTKFSRLLLALLQVRGVGVVKLRQFMRSPKNVIETDWWGTASTMFASVTKFNEATEKDALDRADSIIEKCFSEDIAIISLFDSAYPRLLRDIEDAPPIVYVKGALSALELMSVAVVGTRKASERGKQAAATISKSLAKYNYGVVSGLALGIDAAAHGGALQAHGITIAVLAHGLDTVAPTSHRQLAKEIIETGGALISEHAPGVPPRPAEFVRRNRIQSGMSIGSIIVESGEVGGAIHQANFTRNQGRLLWVVCPQESKEAEGFNYAGARYLIEKAHAHAISGTRELLIELMRAKNSQDNHLRTEVSTSYESDNL